MKLYIACAQRKRTFSSTSATGRPIRCSLLRNSLLLPPSSLRFVLLNSFWFFPLGFCRGWVARNYETNHYVVQRCRQIAATDHIIRGCGMSLSIDSTSFASHMIIKAGTLKTRQKQWLFFLRWIIKTSFYIVQVTYRWE